jgi:hypothetical protein
MLDELSTAGCVLRPESVRDGMLDRLLDACAWDGACASVHHRSGVTYGLRGLLWSSASLLPALEASGLSALAGEVLGAPAFPIDAIFFDKTADANWAVPSHQDRLMPIASGCAPAKATRGGIEYAEPSAATLAGLVALRIHFDDVGSDAGALQIVPGSHRLGVLRPGAIRDIPLAEYRTCTASRGDVLAMRPLLLHRSGKRSTHHHRRRVLHVVYATEQPEAPLRWRSSA